MASDLVQMPGLGATIYSTAEIVAFLHRLQAGRMDEFVHVFFLDRAGRMIWSQTVSEGAATHALVDYRELIALALRLNATSVILAHNHPSGALRPSAGDVTATLELERVCSKIGIALLDHLIVATAGCFSFRAEGILGTVA